MSARRVAAPLAQRAERAVRGRNEDRREPRDASHGGPARDRGRVGLALEFACPDERERAAVDARGSMGPVALRLNPREGDPCRPLRGRHRLQALRDARGLARQLHERRGAARSHIVRRVAAEEEQACCDGRKGRVDESVEAHVGLGCRGSPLDARAHAQIPKKKAPGEKLAGCGMTSFSSIRRVLLRMREAHPPASEESFFGCVKSIPQHPKSPSSDA